VAEQLEAETEAAVGQVAGDFGDVLQTEYEAAQQELNSLVETHVIADYSTHSVIETARDQLTAGEIQDAIDRPLTDPFTPTDYPGTVNYIGRDATAVLNEQGGLVTTWRTDPQVATYYERGGQP
jgi:hypothetical protein